MDSIIQICSELSDLANIISNPGMYLQPIMSAMISELTLCHHKRLCCNCANGSRQKAHGRRVHLTFHPIPRNAETSSGGQLWQEHEDHCKPTCLLLIFERRTTQDVGNSNWIRGKWADALGSNIATLSQKRPSWRVLKGGNARSNMNTLEV